MRVIIEPDYEKLSQWAARYIASRLKAHERSGEKIHAVFGGTHLVEAGDERITGSVNSLRSDGVDVIGMCHCSGLHAEEMARDMLGSSASGLSVGDCVII